MATITKNYSENWESSHQSWWTLTFTASNITASGASTNLPIALSAKYQANKDSAQVDLWAHIVCNGVSFYERDSETWYLEIWKNWANNTVKSVGTLNFPITTSSIFTAANKTTRTLNISLVQDNIYLESWQNPSGERQEHDNGYDSYGAVSLGTIATITLNAPPICTTTTTSSGTYYAGISTYSVNITGLAAYYGGDISSVVLNVGGKTASRSTNGELSVTVPSTAGAYTPTVTVTDTRGQARSYSLTAITVAPHTAPTLEPTVTSSGPYYNIGTTYSVTVADITTYEGASVSSIALSIGSQIDARTGSFSDPFEINPDTIGPFTPQIIISDTYGASRVYQLPEIDVQGYSAPSVSFPVPIERTLPKTGTPGPIGKPDDEGEHATITATFTFTDVIARLLEPSVIMTEEGGSQTTPAVTWYSSRAADGTLSGSVTWADLSTGATVYGLVPNLNTQYSYTISVRPRDTEGTGSAISQTVAAAFYTVDFLAGGHGVAFGKPASRPGFDCDMVPFFNTWIGIVQQFAGMTAPEGWLMCDGSAVSRTDYAALFAVIGTTYGTGDGSTTFNLPDLQGRVPIGANSTYALGVPGGATTSTTGNHTLTTTEIPAHTHGQRALTGNWYCVNLNSVTADGIMTKSAYSSSSYTGFSSNSRAGSKVAINATHTHDSVGGGGAHNHGSVSTMQPYIPLNFIIYAGA